VFEEGEAVMKGSEVSKIARIASQLDSARKVRDNLEVATGDVVPAFLGSLFGGDGGVWVWVPRDVAQRSTAAAIVEYEDVLRAAGVDPAA
jgi:hypothetical protein